MNDTFKPILTCTTTLTGVFSCYLSIYYGEIKKNPVDSLLYGLVGAACIIAAACCITY